MTAVPPALPPGLDEPCPRCGVLVGDHTIRGYGECLDAAGFNYHVPFEEVPGGPVRMTADADQMVVGAIDVVAACTDTAFGKLPMVGFRFYAAGVTPMSKVPTPLYLLVGDADILQRTKELVIKNVNAAIRAAR